MIASFKSGRDAVAKAIGVDDAKWRPEYRFTEPVKGGAVVVEVVAAWATIACIFSGFVRK